MSRNYAVVLASVLGVLGLGTRPARATFHFMQIEQVIAGVNGDTSVQAIQLRMRFGVQNHVFGKRLIVRDASGMNPILLIDFPDDVANGELGDRILVASAHFADHTDTSLTPDFILDQLIPESYLAAGSLTFEDEFETVYWRLSWGGSGYTGDNSGSALNDDDGDYGPPVDGPLPTAGLEALLFDGPANARSTRNIDDYILTPAAAQFTNNSRESGTIGVGCDPCDMNCDGSVNAFDIESFLDLLFGKGVPCGSCTGDANGDKNIDAFDIEPFLDCLFG